MTTLSAALGSDLAGRSIADDRADVPLGTIAAGTILGGRVAELTGRSVLIAVPDQLRAGLAAIEIDGLARRLLLTPPDLNLDHIPSLLADAEIDAVVCADAEPWLARGVPLVVTASLPAVAAPPPARVCETEWLMLTSGTTGAPKIVCHSLAALTGAITADGSRHGPAPVWATFYDIRRYGGLQIFLRAVVGGGSLVLSAPGEAVHDHLDRLASRGVTHVSGTPSHWRKVMMSGALERFRPSYVRLSGEIADQAVLDGLRRAFPDAAIGHAYASTEAGVGFAVDDGREGFPAAFLDAPPHGVEMKVVDGSLRIRSSRAARAYVGREAAALQDADGFIDTGDFVELRDGRYRFVGRRGGIINVGGLKVHPEEVESVINRHEGVRLSRVRSRKSPITGSIVIAEVWLTDLADAARKGEIRNAIMAACRTALPQHKVPATVSFVASLEVTASGKLARLDA